jgi:TRAP-type C4-dicarboxylate transport system permease small subunit
MNLCKTISTASHYLDVAAKVLCVPVGFCFFICIIVQITARYVLKISINWPMDIISLSFMWAVFLAISIGFKQGVHIEFGFFLDRLPQKQRLLCNVVSHFISVLFFVYMIYYGIEQYISMAIVQFLVIELSKKWFALVVPISGVIMFFHGLDNLLENIKKFREL